MAKALTILNRPVSKVDYYFASESWLYSTNNYTWVAIPNGIKLPTGKYAKKDFQDFMKGDNDDIEPVDVLDEKEVIITPKQLNNFDGGDLEDLKLLYKAVKQGNDLSFCSSNVFIIESVAYLIDFNLIIRLKLNSWPIKRDLALSANGLYVAAMTFSDASQIHYRLEGDKLYLLDKHNMVVLKHSQFDLEGRWPPDLFKKVDFDSKEFKLTKPAQENQLKSFYTKYKITSQFETEEKVKIQSGLFTAIRGKFNVERANRID